MSDFSPTATRNNILLLFTLAAFDESPRRRSADDDFADMGELEMSGLLLCNNGWWRLTEKGRYVLTRATQARMN